MSLCLAKNLRDDAQCVIVDNQAEFSVARGAGETALAREFTRVFLTRTNYAGAHDEVVLVTSELVTNALRHGCGEVVLRMSGGRDRVRLEVVDQGRRRPRQRPGDTTGGWGLMLITALTADWGVDERAWGKTVWSEFEATPSMV